MKIALIVVCGVVLMTAGIVVLGSLLPKAHVASRSASYRATPDQLFSLIEGPQNWRPDVLHCENVPDTGGRRLMREITRDGKTVTYEVLESVPPTSIKRRIVTDNLPYSGTWTFLLQSSAGGAIVRITENGEVYNPLFRFVSRFVIGHHRTIDAYLRALGKATGQEVQIKD